MKVQAITVLRDGDMLPLKCIMDLNQVEEVVDLSVFANPFTQQLFITVLF